MTDFLIIGGGQAGLAAARELRLAGHAARVLEAHARIGDNWRRRWAGLRLFTPARYSALPGLDFPADPYHLPSREAFADYLEAYAKTAELDVVTGACVTRLERGGGGEGFRTHVGEGRAFESRRVVIASGAYRTPRLPSFAERLPPSLPALHSSQIRSTDEWPGGKGKRVLVVGAGASGGQLAVLLSRKHEVTLAGRDPGTLPRTVLGRDVYDYLYGLRLLRVPVDGFLGRRLRGVPGEGEVTVGASVAERSAEYGVRRCARIEAYSGGAFRTSDGETVAGVEAVLFATGYRNRYDFVAVPGALDDDGRPVHRSGRSPVAGLYWMGLPMMRTLSSALVGGVGADARALAASTLK